MIKHNPWLHECRNLCHHVGSFTVNDTCVVLTDRKPKGRTLAWSWLLGVASPFGLSAGLLLALAVLCSRCFGPVRPPPGTVRSDWSVLSPFFGPTYAEGDYGCPPLFSIASQASHAAAAGRPPELPQRTASSLIDSGLGGVGGDVVFSAGTRRVPFTPTRAAWTKLRVSHDSNAPPVRHPGLLTRRPPLQVQCHWSRFHHHYHHGI